MAVSDGRAADVDDRDSLELAAVDVAKVAYFVVAAFEEVPRLPGLGKGSDLDIVA